MEIIATDGFMPERATDGSAGYDVRANWEGTVEPGDRELVPLGFSMAMGGGGKVAAMLLPRSGLGHKEGIVLGNLVGLIDGDYQGEVKASIWNTSPVPFRIQRGDRIAQLVFTLVLLPEFTPVPEFSIQTARGAGGFGHTGGN